MNLIGRSRLGFVRKPYTNGTDSSAMGARLRADLLSTLAGNVRHMTEVVNGIQTIDGERIPPCAPLAAHSGEPGHDHSGGMYGAPIQRPLASALYGNNDTQIGGANIIGGRAPTASVTAASTHATVMDSILGCIDIPMCAPDGCYGSATLCICYYASADVTVELFWENNGIPINDSFDTGGAGHGFYDFASPVMLRPGGIQDARLRMVIARKAADTEATLRGWTLQQTAGDP